MSAAPRDPVEKPPPGFHDLVRDAQDGNREAMDRVVEVLRPYVEPLARVYAHPLKPKQSTADLLQESCLRAWEKIGSFRAGENDDETFAMFRAWLSTIVRRLGLNAGRDQNRKKRHPEGGLVSLDRVRAASDSSLGQGLEVASDDTSPSGQASNDELAHKARSALKKIGDELDARIVQLYFFEGQSLVRISSELGRSYGDIRRRYFRAVKELERHLSDSE